MQIGDTLLGGVGNDTVSGMGDLTPAAVPALISTPIPDAAQITALDAGAFDISGDGALGVAQSVVDAIDQTIAADINACLDSCKGTLGVCIGCIQGAIQSVLDAAEKTYGKAVQRIETSVQDTAKEMARLAFASGVNPPTPEQFEAAWAGNPIPEPEPTAPPAVPATSSEGTLDSDTKASIKQAVTDAIKAAVPPSGLTGGTTSPSSTNGGTAANGGATAGQCTPTVADDGWGAVSPPGVYYGPFEDPGLTNPENRFPGQYPPFAYDSAGVLYARGWTRVIGSVRDLPIVTGHPGTVTSCVPALDLFSCTLDSVGSWDVPTWQPAVNAGATPPPCTPPPPPPPPPECPPCQTLPGGGGPEPDLPAPTGPAHCDPARWQEWKERTVGEPNPIGTQPPTTTETQPQAESSGWLDFFGGLFSGLGTDNSLATVAQAVTSGMAGAAANAKEISDSELGQQDCDIAEATRWTFAKWGTGLFRFLKLLPPQTELVENYHINYECPVLVPSAEQCISCYVRGTLDKDEWEFGTKLNGWCPEWTKRVTEAQYQRISIRDAYRLWKLEKLDTNEKDKAWQYNGVDLKTDSLTWELAQKQYPPLSDIVRMMLRDVADPKVVDKFGLDADFDQKFQGFLKQWAEAQGVDAEIMRPYWQAHWQNPAPAQVFDWLHRFRIDDRDPDDPSRNLQFDEDDAREALRIADYMPGLLDFYVGASYRVPGRIDLRRMYENDPDVDVDFLRRGFRDLGYRFDSADRLANFYATDGAARRAKNLGLLQPAEVLKAYTDGVISQKDAESLLRSAGLRDPRVPNMLTAADQRRTIKSRSDQVKWLKKRYFLGEFTQPQATGELAAIGIDSVRAVEFSQAWENERKSRAKQPAVAMLCKWFDQGIINLDEYMQRIRNLGYVESDALRVAESCTIGIQERKAKELEREAERQRKAQIAANKEAARLRRQQMPHRRISHIIKQVASTKVNGLTRSVTDTDTTTQDLTPPG